MATDHFNILAVVVEWNFLQLEIRNHSDVNMSSLKRPHNVGFWTITKDHYYYHHQEMLRY